MIGIVAAATLVVAAGGFGAWFALRPSGPGAAAQNYLGALAAADPASAVQALACDGTDSTTLIGAFAGVTETITDPTVGEVIEQQESARATVAYSLDGQSREATLSLVSTAGVWRIACDGLGALEVSTTHGDTIAVGTQLLAADTTVAVLPGGYDITAAPVGILEGTATAAVPIGAVTPVSLDSTLSPAGRDAAAAQVQAYIDACAAPAATVPPNCGIRVPWAADLATLESIAFRIETAPTLTLSDDLSSFDATDGVIVATATGTTRAGAQASFTYRADDWALRGTITFTGNEMTLAVG
ncbi:hypothetical protein GCM10009808_13250 [Microbacterium sediminicola]|uniref:Uncharacterized protein n=1 Tax=Microbacterium sediminicola TaxID=415210 RepID=A0ABN2I213_9MICO